MYSYFTSMPVSDRVKEPLLDKLPVSVVLLVNFCAQPQPRNQARPARGNVVDGARGPRRDARRRVDVVWAGKDRSPRPTASAAAWHRGAARGVCTRTRPSNASVSKENSLCVSMPCVDNTQVASAERKTKDQARSYEDSCELGSGERRGIARTLPSRSFESLPILANIFGICTRTHRQRLAHGLRWVVRMPALPPSSAEHSSRAACCGLLRVRG